MKRGLTVLRVLQVMIIILVIFLILLSFSQKTSLAIDTTTRIKACSTSILAADASKFIFDMATPTEHKIPINCLRDITILGNNIIEGSLLNPKVNQAKLIKKIGEIMLEAKSAAAHFEKDPWSDVERGDSKQEEEEIVFCIIWDELVFSKKLIKIAEKNPLEISIADFCSKPTPKNSYCQMLFGTNNINLLSKLPELKNNKFEIMDGSQIVMRLYKPDLREVWNPMRWVDYTCPECKGQWSISIINPDVPLAKEVEFIVPGGSKLLDDDGDPVKESYCKRILN